MGILVTAGAEGDEVLLGIVTQSAPGVDVVDLEIRRSAAALVAPAISFQHLSAELAVGLWVKNLPLSDYEGADLAYSLERRELGIKGGLQNHYAATFGGINFMEFHKDLVIANPLRVGRDILNELEHSFLLCYTGKTRLWAHVIEVQTWRCERSEEKCLEALRQQRHLAIETKNALLRRLDGFWRTVARCLGVEEGSLSQDQQRPD